MSPPPVVFRRAAADDLAAIVGLLADDLLGREREHAAAELDSGYREAFAAIEQDPNQLLAVAERDRQVIGVLQLSFIPGLTRRGMWRGQIEGVRVGSGERGRHRPQLYRMGDRTMPRRGCGLVQLTPTSAARTRTGSTKRSARRDARGLLEL